MDTSAVTTPLAAPQSEDAEQKNPSLEALQVARKYVSGPNARLNLALVLDAFRRDGVEKERERCLLAAQSEPELLGEPPAAILTAIEEDAAEVMRVVCRATKRGIIKRIRVGECA